MSKEYRNIIIKRLKEKYGKIEPVGSGFSLYYVPAADFMVYFRYSKIHKVQKAEKTFYGIRKGDIDLMQGKESFICFFTDDERKNMVIPYRQFEHYFLSVPPASDGQYKAFSLYKQTGAELYFNNIGKFNAENYVGIDKLFDIETKGLPVPKLAHNQVQSLIGAIGIKKGFDIWFPQHDKSGIDNSILESSKIRNDLPNYGSAINHIISEIDMIWLENTKPVSFYEVEHTTPIYSGLLRFNDVLLTIPNAENFNITAAEDKENKFSREINRPTFKQNKLIDKVTFIDYDNIYNWYFNLYGNVYTA